MDFSPAIQPKTKKNKFFLWFAASQTELQYEGGSLKCYQKVHDHDHPTHVSGCHSNWDRSSVRGTWWQHLKIVPLGEYTIYIYAHITAVYQIFKQVVVAMAQNTD